MSTEVGAGSEHSFQVNLAGLITLLSQHLYSGPHVYLRELLQNAVDAVQARRRHESGFTGEVTIELMSGPDGLSTLLFEDNGIGLTEADVHTFLSTIGLSSKSEDLARRRGDFIGQFGIGLLSCFMVTDEIVMISRSAQSGSPTIEWRGTGDGRYNLRRLANSEARIGTKVFLRARRDTVACFQPEFVRSHLRRYGSLLTARIELVIDGQRTAISGAVPPWRLGSVSPAEWQKAALDFGQEQFGQQFLDCLPLRVPEIGLEGVAYILPQSPSLAARRADRVYVKNMLLAESTDRLLPEWAFFVRCVFNATGLNPGASREALQEDQRFDQARAGLEKNLRDYLLGLVRHDHAKLRELITIHFRAIKLLAAEDDEMYRMFIDWLPFETSLGDQSLQSIRQAGTEILFADQIDTFRQLAAVASAQQICIINAGYVCDVDLIQRLPEFFPGTTIRRLEPGDLLDSLQELPLADQGGLQNALQQIEGVLRPYQCDVDLKRFDPVDLPALFAVGSTARFQRDLERTKEVSNDLWAGVLNGISRTPRAGAERSRLCLNWQNPVVRRLLSVQQPEVLRRAIEVLYVQALLQGHYPLDARERRILGEGLTGLIELAVAPAAASAAA